MKLITPLLILLSLSSMAQDKLINTYSSYFQIHGGAEDSGTSRREFYYFVASAPIEIKGIVYENPNLMMKKGDTLVMTINSHIPNSPHSNTAHLDSTIYKEAETKSEYSVVKKGHVWYITPIWPTEWNREIEYIWKKKLLIAKTKEGFDAGSTEAAP